MPDVSLLKSMLKFSMVGVLNTAVTFIVFNTLIFFTGITAGIFAGLMYLVAYGAGIVNSFFWNKWWVFKHGESRSSHEEIVRFFGVSITVGLIGSGIVYLLTTYVSIPGIGPHLWANIAAIVVFPVSLLGNFFGFKIFVFKNPQT